MHYRMLSQIAAREPLSVLKARLLLKDGMRGLAFLMLALIAF